MSRPLPPMLLLPLLRTVAFAEPVETGIPNVSAEVAELRTAKVVRGSRSAT
jgi:hypothetical protein